MSVTHLWLGAFAKWRGVPQRLHALEGRVDLSFNFADDEPMAIHFDGDAGLLCKGRERQALGVAARLHFDTDQRCALFLGFDDAAGFAVDIQQVVGKAKTRIEGELADGDAKGCMDVRIGYAADVPAR